MIADDVGQTVILVIDPFFEELDYRTSQLHERKVNFFRENIYTDDTDNEHY